MGVFFSLFGDKVNGFPQGCVGKAAVLAVLAPSSWLLTGLEAEIGTGGQESIIWGRGVETKNCPPPLSIHEAGTCSNSF